MMVPIIVAIVSGVVLLVLFRPSQPRSKFRTLGTSHKVSISILQQFQIKTVGELFYKRINLTPNAPAYHEKIEGEWRETTWKEFYDSAAKVASYLVDDLKLPRGSKICVLGPTKSTWVIIDMGIQLSGCVSVGIYAHQSSDQYKYIIEHCEADVVFVDSQGELHKVLEAAADLSHVKSIIVWDDNLVEKGNYPSKVKGWSVTQKKVLDEKTVIDRITLKEPAEIAVFVYTSGTTGPPKAVMLSHRNIMALGNSLAGSASFYEDDLSFNFLPLSHVAEKIIGFYNTRLTTGMTNCFATSVASVLPELQEVRPTVFGSVPRIFEKAYAKINTEISKKPAFVQNLFAWATSVGTEWARLQYKEHKPVSLSLRIKHWFAYKIFKRVRNAFGGRVRHMAVGAAPLDIKIVEFFWGCGIPIYEVYGMTEITALSHINRPAEITLGTVGRSIKNVDCKIAEDGEILVRAPFVFEGYYKDPAATRETKDAEGWLHTGDIGTMDKDGFLKITDRKKHLIITSGGKNLSPANIENTIKVQDPHISQVHVHGDKRPFVVALIAPSPLDTLEWGVSRGILDEPLFKSLEKELLGNPVLRSEQLNQATAKVTSHPDLIALFRTAVVKGNKLLSQVEQVKKFYLMDRDFSQEHGELTPTMKMKRRYMEQKFASLFDSIYANETGISVYEFEKQE